MRLDIVEIESANELYFDVDPISTACRNRVRVKIESDYPKISSGPIKGPGFGPSLQECQLNHSL